MNTVNTSSPQEDIPKKEEDTMKDSVVKGLAALGLIALLSVIVWVSVQALSLTPSILGGLGAAVTNFTARFFPAQIESLSITIESQNVKSDEPFTLSWTDSQVDAATYALTYECADSFTLSFITKEGVVIRPTCGQAKTFTTEVKSLAVTPKSPRNRFLDVALRLDLMKDGNVAATDTVLITVLNEKVSMNNSSASSTAATATPPKTTGGSGTIRLPPVYTTIPAYPVSDPNGYIDLEIKIVAVGILEKNGTVTPTNNKLDRDKRGGVTFLVTNRGTKTSPAFSFEAKLPTRPTTTFEPRSSDRKELSPGASIEYTLGFNKITSKDTGVISIVIDPDRDIVESNRLNNTVTIDVTIVED